MQDNQKESTSPSLLLNKMPSEILILIFEKLSVCSATCFGLTCHSVHDIWMKHIYRGPVSLDELEESTVEWTIMSTKHTCLGYLLSDWRGIGPRFRLWRPDIMFFELRSEVSLPAWHFVPRGTYGEQPVQKRAAGLCWRDFSLDSRLFLRYQDYHLMHIEDTFHLPNPRNMSGEEWELKAIDAIDQDREQHDNQSEWIKFWEKTCFWRWESTKIMHKEMERRAASVAELVDQEKRKGRGWLRRVEARRRQ